MADSTGLDLEGGSQPHEDVDLKFQDFGDTKLLDDIGDSELQQEEDGDMLGGDEEDDNTELLSGKKKTPPFWSFEYYQQFFDVDTSQVGRRLLGSFVPKFGNTYLDTHIRPSPDLYGPFWVCVTLVFTIVISSDLSAYFHNYGTGTGHSTNFTWINFAAVAVFGYALLVPAVFYCFLYWRGVPSGQTFLELICLYGYSLTLYIPAALICMYNQEVFRIIVVLLASALSGYSLFTSLWKGLEKESKNVAITVICVAVLLHAALAVGFFMYFFPAAYDSPTAATITSTAAAAAPSTPKPAVNNDNTILQSGNA